MSDNVKFVCDISDR